MNSIIMNFDDSADINSVYNHLIEKYPKINITKKTEKNTAKAFQEKMEYELKKLGINNEEEFMDWMNIVIKETRRERRGENNI
ncbi:MAG: hypothetical protein FWH10_03790 [Oscillospiraceae bacterium]|nr:hypothetical protein [Oscillospiraceae bacterium]